MTSTKAVSKTEDRKMELKFNKKQLDTLGTLLGLTAGIFTVLGTQNVVDQKIAGTVSGIATVFLGYVVQRPASSPPTTEQVEEEQTKG